MRWMIRTIALLGLAGCGGEPEDSATLVPVTGTITQNGKPLANARVFFTPDSGNKYNTPGGDSTGPAGNYKLMFKNRSGVSSGKYKVTVEPPLGGSESSEKIPDSIKGQAIMVEKLLATKKSKVKKAAGSKASFDAEVSDKAEVLDFDVKAAP
jgi:hypothetical protein